MKSCPICKNKLASAIFYATEVDYCPRCLGMFFEADELQAAKDAKDKDLKWFDLDLWKDKTKFKVGFGIRLCPECRLPLYEVRYGDSKVIVDVCNLCHGIWLDRGEFKKIMAYLKSQANWRLLNAYTKDFLSEFWEIFTGPESFREELEDFIILLKLLNYKFAAQYPKIAKLISGLPR